MSDKPVVIAILETDTGDRIGINPAHVVTLTESGDCTFVETITETVRVRGTIEYVAAALAGR